MDECESLQTQIDSLRLELAGLLMIFWGMAKSDSCLAGRDRCDPWERQGCSVHSDPTAEAVETTSEIARAQLSHTDGNPACHGKVFGGMQRSCSDTPGRDRNR